MKYYRCKYFELYELLPKKIWKLFRERGWIDDQGNGFAWTFFDERALKTIDHLRELFGTIFINTWNLPKNIIKIYGYHQFRGYRSQYCKIGAEFSAHKFWKAFDCIFVEAKAFEIRNYIFEHPEEFPYITAVEIEISWLHFAVINWADGILKIKP